MTFLCRETLCFQRYKNIPLTTALFRDYLTFLNSIFNRKCLEKYCSYLFFRKCVKTSYKERGLTKVEAVCIDNCVVKYMQFDHNTKNHLREIQEPMQLEQLKYAQMELGRQMGL